MKRNDFISHLLLIKKILNDSKNTRIILLYNDYTIPQQKTIDSLCRRTNQLVGQVTQSDVGEAIDEISRLIMANHEPFTVKDQIKYVIVGNNILNKSEAEHLRV